MAVQEKELVRADIESACGRIEAALTDLEYDFRAMVPAQATMADYTNLSSRMGDIRGGYGQLWRTLWIPSEK